MISAEKLCCEEIDFDHHHCLEKVKIIKQSIFRYVNPTEGKFVPVKVIQILES